MIQGTPHALPAAIKHMGVNHRGRHIRMTEQFLHGADIVAKLQQMRRKGMPQAVAVDLFVDTRTLSGDLDRLLQPIK